MLAYGGIGNCEMALGVLQLVSLVPPSTTLIGVALAVAEPQRLIARLVLQQWHRHRPDEVAAAAERFFAALSSRHAVSPAT
jgi:hypothetical protein